MNDSKEVTGVRNEDSVKGDFPQFSRPGLIRSVLNTGIKIQDRDLFTEFTRQDLMTHPVVVIERCTSGHTMFRYSKEENPLKKDAKKKHTRSEV